MALTANAELMFSFGPFRLFPDRQLLLLGDQPVKVGARAFELLRELVQRGGELVSKADLLAAAWPDTFVHDSNLKVNMHSLRRLLGDTQASPKYVATVAGRGYRFVVPVKASIADRVGSEVWLASSLPSPAPLERDIVGRAPDVARLLEALRGSRLVTVVGAGGVGKTSLAIAAASAMESELADGVCFVDLSTIDDPTLVPAALVAALGIRGDPGDMLTAVSRYLCNRQMLVILDNCEHVLSAAAVAARQLVTADGKARLLATSREPLGPPIEKIIRVDALAFPTDPTGLTINTALRFSAIDLFHRRATQWAGYDLTDGDCPAIANICRALGGLPLAIELAAAQMEFHTAHDLLAMLAEHAHFANVHSESPPLRQRTLFDTIAWSYRLLPQHEATIFRMVSTFAADFDVEDAIAIAAEDKLGPVDVTMGLGALVAKSLVVAEVQGASLRYRLLDSTRRYAAERLAEEVHAPQIQLQHAHRILALFEQSEAEWDWRETGEWTRCYLGRLADLRAALSWAFGHAGDALLGIRLTVAALPLLFEASIISEARALVRQALERAQAIPCDDLLKAKLTCFQAWSMIYAPALPPDTEQVWREAIAFAERAGSVRYQQLALLGFAWYLIQTGCVAQSIEQLEEFRHLCDRQREWSAAPEGDRFLALAGAFAGRLGEARQVLDGLAAAYPRIDRRSRMAGFQVDRYIGIRCYLSFVAWLDGNPTYAAATARDAINAAGRLGHLVSQSNALALAALPVAFWNGDLPGVARYAALLESNLDVENIATWMPVQRFYSAALADQCGMADATSEMRRAIDALLESRLRSRIGLYLGILTESLIRQGRLDEASGTIATAHRYQVQQGERWCRCELQRIEANLLAHGGDHVGAERLRQAALIEARAIGAVSFELRIASDLAARWIDIDRPADARRILEPVYDRFAEGFMTRDLRVAAKLLRKAVTIAA